MSLDWVALSSLVWLFVHPRIPSSSVPSFSSPLSHTTSPTHGHGGHGHGGHGRGGHGRGGLQCFRDQTICVSHSCTVSSLILLSSGWCLFYFICLTRQCPGASLSEGSFRLLANTSDSHQWSLWFPSQSSKAITCQNFNPPKWIYINSQWVKFDKFNMKAL